ncbi:MAG: glycine cleavage system aminomethyltransferase GcvT [Clostridia bacterium]|nr:glycine cleavage system aminomethyltransferase GcvT [Clostridia bacterium]
MTKQTPLYNAHVRHGGKMVEFGGFILPIQYETGLITEHNAVRHDAGIFDVSHMGEFDISGKGAFNTVQNLVCNDITGMNNGDCRYTMMLNDNGGIVDDFIVYKFSDTHYWLVVNAGNTPKDDAWVKNHLLPDTVFVNKSDEYGQLALQGPKAEKILNKIVNEKFIPKGNYTFTDDVEICGVKCVISRTGYTGEDGFEIYCPAKATETIFEKLLEIGASDGLIPCGLGCRDTLRFEACMPLYGHELNEDFLATEVGLNIFIKMDKDFVGKAALAQNAPKYKRKGVKLLERGIAREHSDVYDGDRKIGFVTTGTHSPTLGYPIAMVRIEKDFNGDTVDIDVRGKRIKAQIVKMPFYKRTY